MAISPQHSGLQSAQARQSTRMTNLGQLCNAKGESHSSQTNKLQLRNQDAYGSSTQLRACHCLFKHTHVVISVQRVALQQEAAYRVHALSTLRLQIRFDVNYTMQTKRSSIVLKLKRKLKPI